MRASEPLAELMRRFARRRTVKRHEGGRHAGDADDVRAPAILGDKADLDEVVASCNGFFEAMDGGGAHVFGKTDGVGNAHKCMPLGAAIKRSDVRKRAHKRDQFRFFGVTFKIISFVGSSTAYAPFIHSFSTLDDAGCAHYA